MRCPRCAQQAPLSILERHLLTKHGLVLDGKKVRSAWRLIDAAAVVQVLLDIRKDMEAANARAEALGLEPEELAFYDAVAAQYGNLYEPTFLRDLIHQVVQTIRKNLKVDWIEGHREAVKAAVKRVLRKAGVREEDLAPFLGRLIEQAEALFKNWPVAA